MTGKETWNKLMTYASSVLNFNFLRALFLFVILLNLISPSKAQNNPVADSLLSLIKNTSDSDTVIHYHYAALVKQLLLTEPVKAEQICKKWLEMAKKSNYRRGEALAQTGTGELNNARGTYGLALEAFLVAARIYEKLSDFKNASKVSNSIGNTYLGLRNYEKALEFFLLSSNQADKANSKLAKATAAIGLSNVYNRTKKYKEAIEQLHYSRVVFESGNKDNLSAYSYANLAETYNDMGNTDSATYYARKALPLMEKFNNRYGVSLLNQVLGNIDVNKGKFNSALNYYFRSLQIAEEDKAVDNQKDICYQIYQLYEKKNNADQALAYYKKYIQLKDSIYNSESRNKLFELQTKYDTESKEKENKLLTQDKEIARKSLQTQRILSYFIIGVLILVFIFSYISYKNLKRQRKMNVILQQQKELVEQSRKEILDSIMYAKRIQNTILAHKEFISQNIKNHFIYFKPKDIVSGDFYWATSKENFFYLAVCDSTGHGVPGAFMSLLSISFLNEAISEKNITNPNEVFNYVRQKLIENISKEGQKDGFDGILLRLNKNTGEISYAAANNKPILISDNKLIELQGDRMPVGYGEKRDDFSLHHITPKKGDILYLLTDGYADQFGGPKGKKLMYKKLQEFLLNIASQPLEQQTNALEENFESWKGNLEQVDDVCVIGLKVA